MDDGRPGDAPGERRLDRPPSDRYAAAPEPPTSIPSQRGRVAIAALIAVLGALAITVGGGLLAITAGLVVAAIAIGWGVGTVLALGPVERRPATTWWAVAIAVLGVGLGQVGLWLVARQEGGVLSLVDYLAETFGFLVPLELLGAAGAAWWRAR